MRFLLYCSLSLGVLGLSLLFFKYAFKLIWQIEDFTGDFWGILDRIIQIIFTLFVLILCITTTYGVLKIFIINNFFGI